MDRLTRTLLGGGLALVLVSTGCRATRDEVPPGRGYNKTGIQEPPVGFGSAAHAPPANAFGGQIGGAPGNMASGGISTTPPPSNDITGTAPARFGGPGTSMGGDSGLGQPPAIGGSPAGPAPKDNYPPKPPAREFNMPNLDAPPPL